MSLVKEETAVWALEDGYEVVLTDADLVWVRNPMVDLRENYEAFDFAFQMEEIDHLDGQDLNGGFLYAKPTQAALDALNRIITTSYQVQSALTNKFYLSYICLHHMFVAAGR